jgi:diguanylate cyclase (GGDEF)-like protein/PAS domain S-box-containing protein
MPKVKITYKMAIILATMSFGPMVAGNLVSLLTPDVQKIFAERSEVGQKIAINCSKHLNQKDQLGLQRSCRDSLGSVEKLQSIRILRHDGLVLYSSPEHERNWELTPESPSNINQIRIPLNRGDALFAELEIAFEPVSSFWSSGVVKWLMLLGVGFSLNVGSFSLFLNRALSVLDPKSAVPKRVRNTLDTIVGGVVIVDDKGKILLANDSFARWTSTSVDELADRELISLAWSHDESIEWPWEYAIREKKPKTGVKLQLCCGDKELTFMVNATPVFDGDDRITGSLVSFEDISLMEEQRNHLLTVLSDLETSKEQIRRQNEVLHELATRDGLTGALNRRALFEKIDAIWEQRNQGNRGLITIMMDVDHFKKLNDQHGHTAGDSVLKDVVKVVSRIVDGRGILSRYGGEEFCVIMQKATVSEGESMAEEIRAGIQHHLADPYKVTASLGVSSSLFGAPTIGAQIEQADQGLYAAKHSGRNAVRTWSPELEEQAKEEDRKKAEKLAASNVEDHPISYHAVVSLNATLKQRFPMIVEHSNRVAEICVAMARGLLSLEELYALEIAATLHDVGCLGLADGSDDWAQCHQSVSDDLDDARVTASCRILSTAFHSRELLEIVYHQNTPFEKNALIEGGIPLGARIIMIANAYDVLTSTLSNRPLDHDEAIRVLREQSGSKFDPELFERFAESPFGWRPRGLQVDSIVNSRDALMIGYQIERVIHSFDAGDSRVLKARLESLESLAKKIDMPMIGMLVRELKSEVERKAAADWASLVPMLQDLVEMCLTIHRAYLRCEPEESTYV